LQADALQINGVCTTPGKALGFELIALPGGDELITSPNALVTLSYTAEQQKIALASTDIKQESTPCTSKANIQLSAFKLSLASARPVYYYSV